ncbi:NAD-dependent epimerase/dehydratase family protein [Xenorhabdus littoralis]|uniref:NAD-dependent epimerase/dehydratase family protein n=1 Tax=Xenorhabdus littoralis TaxID=2582835 RepID=UPI0029E8156B|nr:NAD-dependent epimerase/dehydratase family protein [Xenorhabdus sp. psl]MDX7991995.1 NAD-dependent epimerase/dehydratase family protein [Xenorhabdus sp. psl]
MKIAILGATSQIFKDILFQWGRLQHSYELFLFSRNLQRASEISSSIKYHGNCYILDIDDFCKSETKFDAIINFIGVGDPAKLEKYGNKILQVTNDYDNHVISYLENHPECKYIFMSSGAVYGTSFSSGVNENSVSTIPINSITDKDFYSISKLYTEVKHRANKDKFIVDVRVFNIFSRFQDINASFFITDAARAIINSDILLVSPDDMLRDYIHPSDLRQIIDLILGQTNKLNIAVDCYSKAPVGKFNLLNMLENKFNLKWKICGNKSIVDASGRKAYYFSDNKIAEKFGYMPKYTSIDTILGELASIIEKHNDVGNI